MTAAKKRILVVEDDADLLEQMRLFLRSEGYDVIDAGSEAAGAALIEKENFSAAVLDLMLENPDSGFVMAYKIKKKDRNIPVIIVTAVTRDTGYTFGAAGTASWIRADAVIQKEMRFEQLKGELDRLLGGKK